MNLKETSQLILLQVQHNADCGKDDKYTLEEIEDIIKRRVVNILEPEGVYQKGEHYEGLGKYIGIIDNHPWDVDYFLREHHFSAHPPRGKDASPINTILIREIKK